jgi:hypothetical protein
MNTERARPAGCVEESQEEIDHARAGGSRARGERTASAAHAAEPGGTRRQGGGPCGARAPFESQDRGGYRTTGRRHHEPEGLQRLRPDAGPEYLAKKHKLQVGRETLRGWMTRAKLWRAKPQRIEKVHQWRQRRSCLGQLVQWDTSEHAWLEGRGPKLYLISMIDDATSRLSARFVMHDSTEQNMRVLWSYLESQGRPEFLHRQGHIICQSTENPARRDSGQRSPGVAADPDRAGFERA